MQAEISEAQNVRSKEQHCLLFLLRNQVNNRQFWMSFMKFLIIFVCASNAASFVNFQSYGFCFSWFETNLSGHINVSSVEESIVYIVIGVFSQHMILSELLTMMWCRDCPFLRRGLMTAFSCAALLQIRLKPERVRFLHPRIHFWA